MTVGEYLVFAIPAVIVSLMLGALIAMNGPRVRLALARAGVGVYSLKRYRLVEVFLPESETRELCLQARLEHGGHGTTSVWSGDRYAAPTKVRLRDTSEFHELAFITRPLGPRRTHVLIISTPLSFDRRPPAGMAIGREEQVDDIANWLARYGPGRISDSPEDDLELLRSDRD